MHSDFSALCGADGAKNPASGENSLLIPCITGNLDGDGFAADCPLHQTFPPIQAIEPPPLHGRGGEGFVKLVA